VTDHSIEARIRELVMLPCSTPGCRKRRNRGRLLPYCALCSKRLTHFGHPRQQRIEKRRIEPFKDMALSFLQQHRADEQVIAAKATMQAMLDIADEPEPPSRLRKSGTFSSDNLKGAKNPAYLVWREFYRLRHPRPWFKRGRRDTPDPVASPQEPVSAWEALKSVVTMWLAYELIGHQLFVNDGLPLTYALADSVLRLRKLEVTGRPSNTTPNRPIASSTKQIVGQRIRDELGVFLIHATEAVKAEEDVRRARQAALYKPIEPRARLAPVEDVPEAEQSPPAREPPASEEKTPALIPTLTNEQEALARAPWTAEDRAAFEAECRQRRVSPFDTTPRQQTNFIRRRRGVPELPPDPPRPGFNRNDFFNK
jgi:hypothetical protein